MALTQEKVLILDFGSQYTQLIARRVRELGVYCEIHRPDLPAANTQQVYERMKSQLQQKVAQYNAEGEGLYSSIVGEADKQVSVITAEADQQAQVLMGEGDAERNKIYASAYNKDPEFFAFYRSLIAYDNSIKAGTPFVMSPDSDFFKYFKSKDGR